MSCGTCTAARFGDAVYAVIWQSSGTTHLLAAKGQLARLGLTVPRLELVTTHMAKNLVANVQNTLTHLPSPKIYAWVDSTVSNHWILGNNQYKQFIDKRVKKIDENAEIQLRHVPTVENPADLANKGGKIKELWWNGPEWLSN